MQQTLNFLFYLVLGVFFSGHAAQAYGDMKTDLDIRQTILNKVMQDSSFSQEAKNVNVVIKNGVVTLSGIVGSFIEKKSLESKAKEVFGVKRVVNQLRIPRVSTTQFNKK